jgi:GNAT superfamily N-acetyltransferase
MIISSLYYDNQSKIINELLQNCSIDLVVDPEDVSVIWGFIVFEIDICHYIYVKHSLRGFGIGRALWRQAEGPIKVTHISPAAEAYLQRNSDAFCYDPYLLRERKQHS